MMNNEWEHVEDVEDCARAEVMGVRGRTDPMD